jgi:hypothetical protein
MGLLYLIIIVIIIIIIVIIIIIAIINCLEFPLIKTHHTNCIMNTGSVSLSGTSDS